MGPPDLVAAFIPSSGQTLIGGLYRAAGTGPLPAAILLHGLPGHEKNLDLALELRQRGIHCLYFHYGGSWGSPGTFSIPGLVPQAAAARDWLLARPEVDPRRVAVIGYSLGGWVATALAANAPGLAACVVVSPLVDPSNAPLPQDLADESAATLQGTTASRLAHEWANLPPADTFARDLAQTPCLLVTADEDELFPPSHYRDFAARIPGLEWVRFPRTGHGFGNARPGLRHTVASWLVRQLP